MHGVWYLIVAYALLWAGFFAYLVSLSQRQNALDRKLEEFRALLASRPARLAHGEPGSDGGASREPERAIQPLEGATIR